MKYVLILALSLVSIASSSANTLLVISNSEGMFDYDSLTQAMERFGAQTVITGIGDQYRKVYEWDGSSQIDFNQLWKQIVSERQNSEQIDVFAMEHGPNDSVLQDLDDDSAIPFGFINRFFSTACSDWGDFTAKADGSALAIGDVNQNLLDAFKKAGVFEYVIHGNENSGALEIPLMVQQFRRNGSWLSGAVAAWNEFDSLLAVALQGFQGFTVDGATDIWGPLFISRPVLGGNNLSSIVAQIPGKNMLSSPTAQFMIAPNSALASSLQTIWPNVYEDSDDVGLATNISAPAKAVQAAAVVIQKVVADYSFNGDGCINPAPVQALFDGLLKRKDGISPKLESVCVSQDSQSDIRIDWVLTPTPEALQFIAAGLDADNVNSTDFWRVSLPDDLATSSSDFTIRGLVLERHGQIRFRNKRDQTKIDITGVNASVDTDDLVGPHFITHDVGITHLSVTDAGEFSAHATAPLFNLPVSVGGVLDGFDAQVIKVLGIPFKLQ